jgi:hypothetical protein
MIIKFTSIPMTLGSEELFYQLGLSQFGSFNRIVLEPAPSLRKLVKLAVDAEEGTKDSRLSKEEIVNVSQSYSVGCTTMPTYHFPSENCGDHHGKERYARRVFLT